MSVRWRAATPEEVLAENARLRRLLAERRIEMEAMAATIWRYRAALQGEADRLPVVPPPLPPLEKRPPRTSRTIPHEDRMMIARLVAAGYSRKAVAEAYGITRTSVLNALRWATLQEEPS